MLFKAKTGQEHKIASYSGLCSNSGPSEKELNEFYYGLQLVLLNEKAYFNIIMGDNAKVGSSREYLDVIGPFGMEKMNTNGERCWDLAQRDNVKIVGTH